MTPQEAQRIRAAALAAIHGHLHTLAVVNRHHPPRVGQNALYDQAMGRGLPHRPPPVAAGAANAGYAAGMAPRSFPRNRRMDPYNRTEHV